MYVIILILKEKVHTKMLECIQLQKCYFDDFALISN